MGGMLIAMYFNQHRLGKFFKRKSYIQRQIRPVEEKLVNFNSDTFCKSHLCTILQALF